MIGRDAYTSSVKRKEKQDLQQQKGEIVRQKLEKYINDNGVKNRHIAMQIGVSDTLVSYFLKGKQNLSLEKIDILQKYLDEIMC